MRVIGLTGVPGTGKTATAASLGDEVAVVDANEVAAAVDAIEGEDPDRGAQIVDQHRLTERARDALPEGRVLVEGHLAHHCDPDAIVLLRCHPDELRARLAERAWPEAKVRENVMAETLDALVPEVQETGRPARELDTTALEPSEVARVVLDVFETGSMDVDALEEPGTVDWTDTLAPEGPS